MVYMQIYSYLGGHVLCAARYYLGNGDHTIVFLHKTPQ